MKVIFLDIDGVLCTNRSHEAYNGSGLMQHLDPVGVKMVERLCLEFDAQIVLSSSWRHHHDKTSMQAILQNAGFSRVRFHDDWATPSKMSLHSRGGEIALWLHEHPEVTRYLILDDDRDMREDQLPFFVRTCTRDGFLYNDYLLAKGILSGRTAPLVDQGSDLEDK